jgi:hypothetical protein
LRHTVYIALLVIIFTTFCTSQHVRDPIPDSLVNDKSEFEMERRIFKTEQEMMRRVRGYSPIVETYIQSLWPDTTAQMPLDDVYFLSRVSFRRYLLSEDNAQATLFGSTKSSRQILADNRQKGELSPRGLAFMLFIDIQDFDADTYRLTYLKPVTLGALNCSMFAVVPLKAKQPGRFKGTIWVENTGFNIVRVKGTFQPLHVRRMQHLNPLGASVGFFLHFDCWREMIAPDLWAPAYVTIDDNVGWKALEGDGATDVHYKGRIIVWGYSYLGSFQNRLLALGNAIASSDPELIGLEKDGIIAPPGTIEQSLDAVIEKISASSHLNLPKVRCRILATTPVEIFHISNTIVVSRGFLEMVPDESTLAVFLAHELAHIALDTAVGAQNDPGHSLFEFSRLGDFQGLGITNRPEDEGRASALTCGILHDSVYALTIGEASTFEEQLAAISQHIPNLTKARFGFGLIEKGRPVHPLPSCVSAGQSVLQSPLQLRGRYLVGVSTGELRSVPSGQTILSR